MHLPMPRHVRITLDAFRARYSVGIAPFKRSTERVCRSLSVHNVSRGPPGLRCRSELQALSNSLQLTSI